MTRLKLVGLSCGINEPSEAQTLATAVHVSDKDFVDERLSAPAALARLTKPVAQLHVLFPQHLRVAEAAE
jgi:hypothetical protein